MAHKEREFLERAVRSIAERTSQASTVVDEAHTAGLDGSHPVTLEAKILRLEMLNVKADLERELGRLVLHCTACGMEVHWVQGVSMSDPGHGGHRFPAPHGDPAV